MPDAQWHRRDVPSSDAVHPRGVIDLDGPALIIMGSGMLLARGSRGRSSKRNARRVAATDDFAGWISAATNRTSPCRSDHLALIQARISAGWTEGVMLNDRANSNRAAAYDVLAHERAVRDPSRRMKALGFACLGMAFLGTASTVVAPRDIPTHASAVTGKDHG